MSLSQVDIAKHNCQQVYTAQQVLNNEALIAKRQNVSMYSLMEKAGAAAFEEALKCWPDIHSMLVLCGKGNNGGDGFIVARLAHQASIKVTVLIICDIVELKGDAQTAFHKMTEAGVEQVFTNPHDSHIKKFQGDVIVDALFGIGFKGKLNTPTLSLIAAINSNNSKTISLDIPSGLCATTGFVDDFSAVIADVTVTFIVYKQGLLTGLSANFVGELTLADLGIGHFFEQQVESEHLYQPSLMKINTKSPLAKRWPASHKGSVGQVLLMGGSVGFPGAIRLAAEASLRAGAALVGVCCHHENRSLVFNGRPELMLVTSEVNELAQSPFLTKAKVIVLGPGLGHLRWSQEIFNLALAHKNNKLMVVDADALILLANKPQFNDEWVLTPHPKEAATLLGCSIREIEVNRFAAVKAIANQYGGICVLKGAGTLISNGKQVVINSTGNAGMASGGMGDVLSGVIASYILQTEHYFAAVCLAVYIHGASGDIIANENGQRGLLASDLFLPIQQLTNQA